MPPDPLRPQVIADEIGRRYGRDSIHDVVTACKLIVMRSALHCMPDLALAIRYVEDFATDIANTIRRRAH